MKRTTTLIAGILTATTALSGTILTSTFVSADDVVDEINITVPVSCSLSGVGMNTHNATINNGQSNSAIGETTIKAFCNDNNGFAIYAIGYTDDTDGNNVLTSSTLGSEHDIVTGTATSGNTSNWAMKLSTITSPAPTYPIIIAGSTADTDKEQGDPDYTSFQEVPDDYALVAKRTSGTDIGQSAEGATLKTTYQAYVSPTQSAGTYTGQVKYTLVHPNDAAAPTKPINYTEEIDCPAGYICYSPASNNTLGTMNVQDVGTYASDTASVIGYQSATSNTTTTLIAPNYKNSGYGFAGWNTEIDGTGTTYGPNEDVTTPDLSGEGLALYAKWLPSAGNMQGWTGCSAMATNQVTALTDTRDNDVYAVAKLVDGNCWMIENLRLDNTATINAQNTNNPAQGFTLSASSDDWCTSGTEDCINQSMVNTNSTNINGVDASGNDLVASPLGNQWYSYGNSYNWYSATAGNGTYSLTNDEADGDICPSNWELPTSQSNNGNGEKDFTKLAIELQNNGFNSATVGIRAYPNNYVYSNAPSLSGFYSSRTPIGDDTIHGLGFIIGNDEVYYGVSSYGLTIGKTSNLSVRCLLKTN